MLFVQSCIYLCMFLSATGCIAPAPVRNRVGRLPAQSSSAGGRGIELEAAVVTRSVAVPLVVAVPPATRAGVQGRIRPVPRSDRSRPPSLAIGGDRRV